MSASSPTPIGGRTTDGPVGGGRRDSAPAIRERLREQILAGQLRPGSEINQAQLAAELGVSRGPVREAFRLLEREGLITARVNHRARVTGLSVEELEHLYTMRVLGESVALSTGVAAFTTDELDELDRLAGVLADPHPDRAGAFDFEAWDEVHQRFHLLLVVHSGERILGSATEWAAHTQRYRRAYAEEAQGLPFGAAEHAELARLCRAGDGPAAARLLARHLARAALTLIAQMEPTHEPALLRTALRQVTTPAPD